MRVGHSLTSTNAAPFFLKSLQYILNSKTICFCKSSSAKFLMSSRAEFSPVTFFYCGSNRETEIVMKFTAQSLESRICNPQAN